MTPEQNMRTSFSDIASIAQDGNNETLLDISVPKVKDLGYYEELYNDLGLRLEEAKLDMLKFVFDTSVKTSSAISKEERGKTRTRKVFMTFLSISLSLSLISAGVLLFVDTFNNCINVSPELFIAFLTSVVAQIASLIVLFIKYITDVKSLEMHETVTKGLLEYLSKNIEK